MPESQLKQSPLASPAQDVRNLQQNSGAVASELRDFLAKMEGKSPKEVLGAIATSGLGKSFAMATFLFVLLTAVLTVAPYSWGLMFPDNDEVAQQTEEATPTEKAEPADVETPPEAPTSTPETASEAEVAGVNLNNGEEIVDKLGVGEIKQAPPNVNPLESATDDLLDGLD